MEEKTRCGFDVKNIIAAYASTAEYILDFSKLSGNTSLLNNVILSLIYMYIFLFTIRRDI